MSHLIVASKKTIAVLSVLSVLTIVIAGCGKKSNLTSEVSVVALPPNAPELHSPEIQAVLRELNGALFKYIQKNGMPANFQEFVSNGGITVPAAPQGLHFMLVQGAVTLGKEKPN